MIQVSRYAVSHALQLQRDAIPVRKRKLERDLQHGTSGVHEAIWAGFTSVIDMAALISTRRSGTCTRTMMMRWAAVRPLPQTGREGDPPTRIKRAFAEAFP